jgi:hypothetical protein
LLLLEDDLRDPPLLDERLFLDAVLLARLFEPDVVRLARERLDAAVGRLELDPERFDPDDLVPLPLERELDELFLESAMSALPFRG